MDGMYACGMFAVEKHDNGAGLPGAAEWGSVTPGTLPAGWRLQQRHTAVTSSYRHAYG